MTDSFLFISGGEIVFVFLIALLLFGSKAIPDVAKMMGKGMREFKKATNEIQREFDTNTSDFKKDIREIQNTVRRETNRVSNDIRHVSAELENEGAKTTQAEEDENKKQL